MRRLLVLPLLAVFLLTACEVDQQLATAPEPAEPLPTDEVIQERVESEEETFRLVRVIDNLEHPWGMAWLEHDRMLITERPGRMLIADTAGTTEVSGLPEITAQNQGGLLDVELHPNYDQNGWIYFTYSAPREGGTSTTLARAQLDGNALTNLEELYVQEPAYSPGRHYGSRISFMDDGTLLFTIGDRGQRDPSQDTQDPTGSTLRLNDDGSIPGDNPFVDDDAVLDEIYTYGHRNVQGMDIDRRTGAVWQHEHGPRGGDELNLIEPGNNYGWPDVTLGTEYRDGSPIGETEAPGVTEPVTYWEPTSIAPSGLAFYTGDSFPNWDGQIFLGALAQQHIRRVVLNGNEVTHEEELLREQIGRIRDVKQGPDGNIYVLTDASNGGLYRLEPTADEAAE